MPQENAFAAGRATPDIALVLGLVYNVFVNDSRPTVWSDDDIAAVMSKVQQADNELEAIATNAGSYLEIVNEVQISSTIYPATTGIQQIWIRDVLTYLVSVASTT